MHLLSANASLLLLSSACLLLLIGVLAGVVVEGQAWHVVDLAYEGEILHTYMRFVHHPRPPSMHS